MKKYSFILIAACAMGLAACSVTPELIITPEAETITFSATIDLPAATRATLNDHAIEWAAGDVIGVANDQNDEIEACAVTPDGVDPTKCTFTATAVGGATTYYAICIGDNITGITFDHTTATFGGLSNSQTDFGKGSIAGAHLSMAGKSTDKASISFSPCLALVKLRMDAESVAAKYAGGYSGVRGMNIIIRHSGSRVIVAGNYTVNLSGEMSVAYVDDASKKDYLQLNEGSSLMSAGTDYYMSVIPAGAVETFNIQFFGFNAEESATWSDIYPMTLSSATSMEPGDMFNFGTLNPVGLQKARDAFVPAITIDGDMADWASVDMYPLDGEKDAFPGDGERVLAWKVKSDAQNIYVYFKLSESQCQSRGTWSGYLPIGFDTDNNAETGEDGSYGMGAGFEARAIAFPLSNSSGSAVTFFAPASPCGDNNIKCPISGSSLGGFITAGCLDGKGSAFVEVRIPREKIGSPATSSTIRMRVAMSSTASAAQTYVLE